MTGSCKIAVAGAGLIGRRHIEIIRTCAPDVGLAAIVDPADEARQFAESLRVPWYSSLEQMFASSRPDGVILATPNQLHVENGLECVAVGCPILVEKPIAVSSADAVALVDAANAADVPLLVGHHRRHNPIVQTARTLIDEGRLGKLITVHSTCWFRKPAEYFAPEWRRKPGAGPIGINAIHDVDLLRYLCGDIVSVQATSTNAARGFEVEDTVVTILKFASGALGTLNLSDSVASPWSWELTSGENAEFSKTTQSCYLVGGSKASLSVPDLRIWQHQNEDGHWKTPITATAISSQNVDPLAAQAAHFVDVIRGNATPLVSGEEGIKSLRVIEAMRQSASRDQAVVLD